MSIILDTVTTDNHTTQHNTAAYSTQLFFLGCFFFLLCAGKNALWCPLLDSLSFVGPPRRPLQLEYMVFFLRAEVQDCEDSVQRLVLPAGVLQR